MVIGEKQRHSIQMSNTNTSFNAVLNHTFLFQLVFIKEISVMDLYKFFILSKTFRGIIQQLFSRVEQGLPGLMNEKIKTFAGIKNLTVARKGMTPLYSIPCEYDIYMWYAINSQDVALVNYLYFIVHRNSFGPAEYFARLIYKIGNPEIIKIYESYVQPREKLLTLGCKSREEIINSNQSSIELLHYINIGNREKIKELIKAGHRLDISNYWKRHILHRLTFNEIILLEEHNHKIEWLELQKSDCFSQWGLSEIEKHVEKLYPGVICAKCGKNHQQTRVAYVSDNDDQFLSDKDW